MVFRRLASQLYELLTDRWSPREYYLVCDRDITKALDLVRASLNGLITFASGFAVTNVALLVSTFSVEGFKTATALFFWGSQWAGLSIFWFNGVLVSYKAAFMSFASNDLLGLDTSGTEIEPQKLDLLEEERARDRRIGRSLLFGLAALALSFASITVGTFLLVLHSEQTANTKDLEIEFYFLKNGTAGYSDLIVPQPSRETSTDETL